MASSWVTLWPTATSAYTPQSREVKKMLDKALTFIEKSGDASRLGGKALVGLAMIKGNRPKDHPKIKEAISGCRDAAKNLRSSKRSDSMYDLGLAIIFLCELDPEQYRTEIKTLMTIMLDWQKRFGGWGYLEGTHVDTGDTSMTQYAVLSLWTADRSGAYEVSINAATKVCNWLIRTQDPSGGWGYQGEDPGGFQRIPQQSSETNEVSHSCSAAGLGSAYVSADLLRLVTATRGGNEGFPSALRVVRKEDTRPTEGPLTNQVDVGRLKRALADGDQWFASRDRIDVEFWTFYYMYARERYESFKELTTGNEPAEPKWYNDGVKFLKREQKANGSWSGEGGPTVDTCFCVLFLTRGTKKSIQRAEAYNGRLRGGRGLPSSTADVAIGEDGQIVKTPFQGQAESLLAILEAGGNDDLDLSAQEIDIQLSSDPKQRERELIRLRRLVTADDYVVRLTAIKALHKTRDLDNVPALIYALGDPDSRIVTRARDSLRLLSRKISGFGLGDNPSDGAKLDAINRWKDWYLTIRPDAQFMN
ncbi:MAG: hypothetical protein GY768_15900 [Planctomycetaceae bacterium]|nr:hypothetical protein [Planctomycetaceae bacterium]